MKLVKHIIEKMRKNACKKYKLSRRDTVIDGISLETLHRIIAIKSFGSVKKSDMGGYVRSYSNLSQEGDAWVFRGSWVTGNARVDGNAHVDFGIVTDNARVDGDAIVTDNSRVDGDAHISGNAQILHHEDYIVFKNWWSSKRHFTWTRKDNMWKVGCFHGTGDELIQKAYKDSERSGREYERVVRYVESIIKDYEQVESKN